MSANLISPSLPGPGPANGISGPGYIGRDGLWDEMATPGGVRPIWQQLLRALDELSLPELLRRWEEAQQLIHENGVTYNVYGDPRGLERPWQLDPIPLLISPEDAQTIEAGLIQRARLLELVLSDLYGPQRLLSEGILPPELVYANPGFLLPCRGMPLAGNHFLHLYAANLGRSTDGTFWVLRDRTQSPSGAGYALENRIVLSRMLPDVFGDFRVQRLALFFRSLRDSLRAIAPRKGDNPRVVLLTPGPYNETYFEHAYLARYLGYTLVEGSDLTVCDNRVYLKLLGGLQPVDVIFRRVDDDYCDPLELRPDSYLGVPGLVEAVRAGNVAVANALGSGLAESAALLAYLPGLCRRLLGEDLKLPSVATWWCGEPQVLEHVIAHLPDMVIKAANGSVRMAPIFGDRLSGEQRAKLIERLRARPRDFVGQEGLPLATTPVLVGGRLEPRQYVLRTYLAAAQDSFTWMPGGLTRATASPDSMVVSMQQGGGSKDTWVLSSGPVSTFSLLRPTLAPQELSRAGGDLPSRVADNLYWLGRYVDRAEGVTRLLRGIVVRLTEKAGLAEATELPVLLRAVTMQCGAFPGFVGPGAAERLAEPEEELLALVFDRWRSGSRASALEAALRVASIVRDRISIDMWRVLSGLGREETAGREAWESVRNGSAATGASFALPDVLDLLSRTVLTLAAFGGLALESMTRGRSWRFLDMGRRLERTLYTINLLHHTLGVAQPNEAPVLDALLEIADSSMTYRRRYLGGLQTAAVLDLLLVDESNPRSVAFQLTALADDVETLPRPDISPTRSPEQRLMLSALSRVCLADVGLLTRVEDNGRRPHLQALLSQLGSELPALSDLITRNYLSHLQTSRHLASQG